MMSCSESPFHTKLYVAVQPGSVATSSRFSWSKWSDVDGDVKRRDRLGALLHEYGHAAGANRVDAPYRIRWP
jgi:hypothetical protein